MKREVDQLHKTASIWPRQRDSGHRHRDCYNDTAASCECVVNYYYFPTTSGRQGGSTDVVADQK